MVFFAFNMLKSKIFMKLVSQGCELDFLEQANLYIDALHHTSLSLLSSRPDSNHKIAFLLILRKSTLLDLQKKFKYKVTQAKLFEPQSSAHNNRVITNYHSLSTVLKNYTENLQNISGLGLKELYNYHQEVRSHYRKMHYRTFQLSDPQKKKHSLKITYSPCMQYTQRQLALLDKKESRHYTSSHRNRNFEIGLSNFVKVEMAHSEQGEKLIYNSFSGPAARIPYQSFNQATPEQRLLLQSITVINQREVMETLFNEKLQQNPTTNIITENYIQLVSPHHGDDDYEQEQFEYTHFAIELMTGRKHQLLGIEQQPINYHYQSRFGCWGLNKYRAIEADTPLGEKHQSINQSALVKLFMDVVKQNPLLKTKYLNEITKIEKKYTDLKKLEEQLIPLKEQIENELVSYCRKHYQKLTASPLIITEDIKHHYQVLQEQINRFNKQHHIILNQYKNIYATQRAFFYLHNMDLTNTLNNLSIPIASNKTVYNQIYLLKNIFELNDQLWEQPEYNFRIQTLLCCLAEELDQSSTKGCKSNNNRGQRLIQKILGFVLHAQFYNNGIYDMSYFDGDKRSELLPFDQAHLKLQALHHQANLGTGGGKFKITKADPFSDNGMWSLAAKWTKFHKMIPNADTVTKSNFFNISYKKFTPISFGLVLLAILPIILFPSLTTLALSLAISIISLSGQMAWFDHLHQTQDDSKHFYRKQNYAF